MVTLMITVYRQTSVKPCVNDWDNDIPSNDHPLSSPSNDTPIPNFFTPLRTVIILYLKTPPANDHPSHQPLTTPSHTTFHITPTTHTHPVRDESPYRNHRRKRCSFTFQRNHTVSGQSTLPYKTLFVTFVQMRSFHPVRDESHPSQSPSEAMLVLISTLPCCVRTSLTSFKRGVLS